MKKSQLIMIWALPILVIGGLFYPMLGYVVLGGIVFILTLSFFKGRYWCWNLCPRGSFLDIVISKVSFNRPLPKIFGRRWLRWLIVVLFIAVMTFRIIRTGGSIIGVGMVFVGACVMTTIFAIIFGVAVRHRAWCAICPMGTLQEKLGKLNPFKKKK